MKISWSVSLLALIAVRGNGQTDADSLGLPSLHAIRTAILGPSYSCRSKEEASRGYLSTVLFLSRQSKQQNSPELQFNGACGAENYFQVNMAGDEMSLIADLGAVPLEEMTAAKVFNYRGVHDWQSYTKFASVAKIEPKHTYAVMINRSDCRGLLVFTVDSHTPDREVKIRYVVKDYEIHTKTERSPGFGWGTSQDPPR
jgi:hypothetical protein